jgi:hypothetical protein
MRIATRHEVKALVLLVGKLLRSKLATKSWVKSKQSTVCHAYCSSCCCYCYCSSWHIGCTDCDACVLGLLVFAFGMVLFEILSLRLPYDHLATPWEVRKAVLAGTPPKLSASEEEYYGSELISIFRRCILFDQNQRPSIDTIRNDLSDIAIKLALHPSTLNRLNGSKKRSSVSAPTSPRKCIPRLVIGEIFPMHLNDDSPPTSPSSPRSISSDSLSLTTTRPELSERTTMRQSPSSFSPPRACASVSFSPPAKPLVGTASPISPLLMPTSSAPPLASKPNSSSNFHTFLLDADPPPPPPPAAAAAAAAPVGFLAFIEEEDMRNLNMRHYSKATKIPRK